MSTASLIGTVTSGSTTTFSDTGIAGTPTVPPSNNYTYNSLNSYFNAALDAFFAHYDAVDGFEFSMHRDGLLFQGYSQAYKFDPSDLDSYEALVLTSPDYTYVNSQGATVNQEFVIIKPYFSTNTNIADAPAPPAWMQNTTQSPAAMVLANDGAFNTGGEQPNANAGVLSDLQNSIVSAFNRGAAANFELRPDDWSNSPLVQTATAETGGQLAADTYYYVVTGANLMPGSGTEYYESVASLELMATTAANGSVQLTWLPLDDTVFTHYRIYRSTTSGSGYQLIDTVENGNSPPLTGYLDDGSTTPTDSSPYAYYAPGTASNWYAGFLHQNSTNDPTNGVSIHGLAYGFGYDDQNGTSTNFTTTIDSTTTVTINVNPWSHETTTGPGQLVMLEQPKTGREGTPVTIEFQAQTAHGTSYVGGGDVMVQLLGKKERTFTVELDETTGKGSLTVDHLKKGLYSFKITASNGVTVSSNHFSMVSKKHHGKMQDLVYAVDEVLSKKLSRKSLNALSRAGFSL